MAERVDLEELYQFAQIVSIAKRSGGNLIEITTNTIEHLSQTIQIKEEIETMTAAKQTDIILLNLLVLPYQETTCPQVHLFLNDLSTNEVLLPTYCSPDTLKDHSLLSLMNSQSNTLQINCFRSTTSFLEILSAKFLSFYILALFSAASSIKTEMDLRRSYIRYGYKTAM